MKIVFVADAHLKGADDPNQVELCRFLDGLRGVDILVVLGDLFEFWTGLNEVVYYRYLPVLKSLMELKEQGTRIIYIEGNHDFSIGAFFTDLLGAEVYPESFYLRVDGRVFFLSHGDTVNKTFTYSLWRAFLRSGVFSVLTALLPPHVVWKIALFLSKRSRAYNQKGFYVERLLRGFARKKIGNGVDGVILAHSHIPGIHAEGNGIYANPGSWAGDRTFLVCEKGEFRLERYQG